MGERVTPGSLDDLKTLDPHRLHVFVAGPGFGEGVAVAFPRRGWLLVDGCCALGTPRRFALHEIVRRWNRGDGDRVLAMVLTHPHADHIDGFVQALDEFAPDWVGITGTKPPRRTLLAAIDEVEKALAAHEGSTRDQTIARRVKTALIAIDAWLEKVGGNRLVPLHDGQRLPIEREVHVRAPDVDEIEHILGALAPGVPLGKRANHLSAVLEIRYGTAAIVLGSDLPCLGWSGGAEADSGWHAVLERHRHLGDHAGLKVPHHGSRGALHPDLLPEGRGNAPRPWWVTPKNGTSDLPRVDAGGGLAWMLGRQPSVLLTAVPASRERQVAEPPPGEVSLATLQARVPQQSNSRGWFTQDALPLRSTRTRGPTDCVWVAAFDQSGELTGRWRGQAAVEVVP